MRDNLPQNPWGLPQPPQPRTPSWADLADYFKTSGQQLGAGYDDVTGAVHNRDISRLIELGAAATEPFAATKGKGGQALQVLKTLFGYGVRPNEQQPKTKELDVSRHGASLFNIPNSLSDPTLPVPSLNNLKALFGAAKQMATPPDPYGAAGLAVQQYRSGDPVSAFETMAGAMPMTGTMKSRHVDPPNVIPPGAKVQNIPINVIEHGESAMPGGKLTWPGAQETIRDYASRNTELPPIELIKRDADEIAEYLAETGVKLPPYFISDGSHRYEAAKLRGMTEIPALVIGE